MTSNVLNTSTPEPSRLARRLNVSDAVVLGLGSMIGAGIFAAAGPAANAAGSGLLIGVLIAGFLAFLNATTMAQLAAVYPESGGTYAYGRRLLGPYWGFLAGWGFVIGKTASCTAMSLTFAYYAFPEYSKPIAVVTVLALTFINYMGVKKTAGLTRVLVILVLSALGIVVFTSLFGGGADTSRLDNWSQRGGIPGILQAAGMMFFAFAGYARIATLGEEVLNPKKTIPKAIVVALSITVVIYIIVMTTAVLCVDVNLLATAKAPLALAVESGKYSEFSPIVRIGACLASLSVLLSLMAGVSRTIFAMASNSDLPKTMSVVHPVHKVPHHAEVTVGFIIAAVVSFADLRSAIGFSSFAILTYYAIANASALKLSAGNRLWPKWMSMLGLIVCIVIAFSLPKVSICGGLVLFVFGSLYYYAHNKRKQQRKK